ADKVREMRRKLGVDGLLGALALQVNIHQGGGIYVNIVETGLDGFSGQLFYRGNFFVSVLLVARKGDLEMVALNEDRAAVTFGDGRAQNVGGVFGRALGGIADLRAGDLEDKSGSFDAFGHAENGAGGLVG